MAIGALMAALWFAVFLVVLYGRLWRNHDDRLTEALMAVSFFAVAALVPALKEEKFRSVKAVFFLCLGAVFILIPMLIGLVVCMIAGFDPTVPA